MTLTLERLTSTLAPRPVRYVDTTGSTNDLCLEWVAQGAPSGAVIVAEQQTKGRGRLGRVWFSPPQTALMFTVILRPSVAALARAPMLGALAVHRAIADLGIDGVGIKWPNDVQINGLKVCGILPEAAWDGGDFGGLVIGIGVNVRVDFSESTFKDSATSLETVLGERVDRLALLQSILSAIDELLPQVETDAFFDLWRDNLNMLGKPIMVEGQQFTAQDVERDGALIIRDEAGKTRRMIAGDIALG